jgi:hypothetical protein
MITFIQRSEWDLYMTSALNDPSLDQIFHRVLVVGVATGKIKATNRAFRDDWVLAITVQNGKVTKIREYIDTQALARASHPARSSNAQP